MRLGLEPVPTTSRFPTLRFTSLGISANGFVSFPFTAAGQFRFRTGFPLRPSTCAGHRNGAQDIVFAGRRQLTGAAPCYSAARLSDSRRGFPATPGRREYSAWDLLEIFVEHLDDGRTVGRPSHRIDECDYSGDAD